jgi:flavin reductase (DIM6/NTAB) family NADH-FMN oxidoreductase RutF
MKRSLGRKALALPTPVWVLGTYDSAGVPNLMTVAWGGICCSKPPAVSVSLREATYSYANLVDRRAFTVNVPSASQAKEADYLGIVSGRDVDKFTAAHLTPIRSDAVDAPYVVEFPLNLECKLIHTLKIGLHTLFVGEILNVLVDEEALNDQGHPRIEAIQPLIFSVGEQSYHRVGERVGPAFVIGRELITP